MTRPTWIVPVMAACLLLGWTAAAHAQDRYQTPCVTKSECDLRQDAIDMKNRRDAWNANVKRNDDYVLQRAQARAQAHADANNGRISRAQEIMHRRHQAAAAN